MFVIGCIEAKICKKTCVGIRIYLKRRLRKGDDWKKKIWFESSRRDLHNALLCTAFGIHNRNVGKKGPGHSSASSIFVKKLPKFTLPVGGACWVGDNWTEYSFPWYRTRDEISNDYFSILNIRITIMKLASIEFHFQIENLEEVSTCSVFSVFCRKR